MNADEIATIQKQLKLRQKFEKECKAEKWSLDDVFYSDRELYVNPDSNNFTWDGRVEKPIWIKAYLKKHNNLDAIRVRPKIELKLTTP